MNTFDSTLNISFLTRRLDRSSSTSIPLVGCRWEWVVWVECNRPDELLNHSAWAISSVYSFTELSCTLIGLIKYCSWSHDYQVSTTNRVSVEFELESISYHSNCHGQPRICIRSLSLYVSSWARGDWVRFIPSFFSMKTLKYIWDWYFIRS